MVVMNRRFERANRFGLWFLGLAAVASATTATGLFVSWGAERGMVDRWLSVPAAVLFAVTSLALLMPGRSLLAGVLQWRRSRAVQQLASRLNVGVEVLLELIPPMGDSAVGYYRPRLRWSSPRTRSPLRWP